LRDYQYVDSHFGVAGVCRTTNYGMPLVNVNLMRYCTQVSVDRTEDYAVYRTRAIPSEWGFEACSTESHDLPWKAYRRGQPYEAARMTLGTVPNLPWHGDTSYPASTNDMYDVGASESGWGLDCSHYELWTCTDAADRQCPTGLACRGRFCALDTAHLTGHARWTNLAPALPMINASLTWAPVQVCARQPSAFNMPTAPTPTTCAPASVVV
jgi:hypothetical protein